MFYSFSNSFRLLLHTLALTLNGLIRSWSPQRISSPDCRWKRDFWYPKASLDHPDSNVRMPQTPRYKFWFGSRWIFFRCSNLDPKSLYVFWIWALVFKKWALLRLLCIWGLVELLFWIVSTGREGLKFWENSLMHCIPQFTAEATVHVSLGQSSMLPVIQYFHLA